MQQVTEHIKTLLKGQSLTAQQTESLLDAVFTGTVPEPLIAAFLTATTFRLPSAAELAGLAKSLRAHALAVKLDHKKIPVLVDTCGTGGGLFKTCNISTAAAIVAAGAGVHVAKHGNRGITSNCGSADVLAELGVKIDAGPETVAECIAHARIGFMFAPAYHPAMKFVQPIRKALGFRTVFNILGPLANPARATAQVLGVADATLLPLVAETLKLLGCKSAMVVHSAGLDEISNLAPTQIYLLKNSSIAQQTLDPEDLGVPRAKVEDLKITDAKTSAKVLRDIITGREKGPRTDVVCLNAAAAVIVANLAQSFPDALRLTQNAINSGAAENCLSELVRISNKA